MGLTFIDFVPRLLEKEALYSTLSLTTGIAGPQYQDFDMLIRRANDWLSQNPKVRVYSCEELDVPGIFDFHSDFQADQTELGPDAAPAFIRVLRLWLREDENAIATHKQLRYISLLPSRLESTPRAFVPRFQTLSETLNVFNDRCRKEHETLSGRLLNIHSSRCRFTSRHCSLDPKRAFWMAPDSGDIHSCFFFRLFLLRDGCSTFRGEIGFKDFPPNYCLQGKHQQPLADNSAQLTDRANNWFQSCDVDILNLQTVDHSSYFKCWRESSGVQEGKILDRPHCVNSQGTVIYHTKVLRVYYTNTARIEPRANQQQQQTHQMKLVHKTFHMPIWNRVVDIRLSNEVLDDPALRYRGEALYRISSWLQANGLELMGMETILVNCSRPKGGVSMETTHFLEPAECHARNTFHALRLYIDCSQCNGNKLPDCAALPKSISVSKSGCSLM